MFQMIQWTVDPGSLLASLIALWVLVKSMQIHGEVKTINGKTIAKIADENEGRRIRDTIPASEQTGSERKYVEDLGDEHKPEGHSR